MTEVYAIARTASATSVGLGRMVLGAHSIVMPLQIRRSPLDLYSTAGGADSSEQDPFPLRSLAPPKRSGPHPLPASMGQLRPNWPAPDLASSCRPVAGHCAERGSGD